MNKTKERVDKLITLSKEQNFPLWLAFATVLHGWVLFEQGQKEEGISQIHEGMADLRAARVEWWRTYHLALLAEAYGKTGQIEKGLEILDEALSMADATEQRHYEAELIRLKGKFLLIQGVSETLLVLPAKDDTFSLETFVAGNTTGEMVGIFCPFIHNTWVVNERARQGECVT